MTQDEIARLQEQFAEQINAMHDALELVLDQSSIESDVSGIFQAWLSSNMLMFENEAILEASIEIDEDVFFMKRCEYDFLNLRTIGPYPRKKYYISTGVLRKSGKEDMTIRVYNERWEENGHKKHIQLLLDTPHTHDSPALVEQLRRVGIRRESRNQGTQGDRPLACDKEEEVDRP